MIHCTKCGLPETYETIRFDSDGVCNICNANTTIRGGDWTSRGQELIRIADLYRGKHPYDCIVPFSGGKDSTFTLWHVVRKLHLRPLVVQFDHGFLRAGVLANNQRTFKELGVNVHTFTPNWHVVRATMREAFIRKGDFCWHCHTGIFAYPMQVALKERTPLIIWGERSTDYTAYYQPDETEEVDETRFDRFVNLGIDAQDMSGMISKDVQFDFRDLEPFRYPKRKDLAALGVRSICLGSFIPWNIPAQVDTISRELGWKTDQVEGMPSRYAYEKIECAMQGIRDYIKWLKRGYGRVTQMTALDLRSGSIDKETAKGLIERHEGMKPATLPIFLDHIGMTENEFNAAVLNTVVPPQVPDFSRPTGTKLHDHHAFHRSTPT